MKKSVRNSFIGLTGGISLIGLSLGTILPLCTLKLSSITDDNLVIGLIIAFNALGLILSTKLSERESIKNGNYKTIKLYSLLTIISCFILNFANNLITMAFCLLLQGITSGVVYNIIESSVNEVLEDKDRGKWVSIHCTIFTLFQLMGPLCVQILQKYFKGYEIFICSVVFNLVFIPYILLKNEQKNNISEQKELDKNKISYYIKNNPSLVISTGLFALFDTLVLSLIPLYCIKEGLTEEMALISASVLLLGDTILEVVFGILADKFGRKKIHYLCTVLLIMTSLLIPLTIHSIYWWPNILLLGGSAGGIYILNMMETGLRFKGRQLIKMTAILGGFWGLFSLIGPLSLGLLMNLLNSWSITIVMTIMGIMLLLGLLKEEKREKNETGN
jgi:MFS family permease